MKDFSRDTIEQLLNRIARRLLITRSVEFAAAGFIAGSLAASIALAAAVFNPPPFTASWYLMVPILGAFIAAAGRLVKGISSFEAGIFLDTRYNLFEQMSMSAELAGKNDDSSTAVCIYQQAAKRAAALPKHLDYKTAGTKTVAFSLLSIALCLVLHTAAMSAAEIDPEIQRLYKQISEMDKSRRVEISNAISNNAGANATSGAVEDLKQIVEVTSREQFDRILEKLRRQGIEIQEIRKVIAQSGEGDQTGVSAASNKGSLQGSVDSPGSSASIPVFIAPEHAASATGSNGSGNDQSTTATLDNGDKWQETKRSASHKLREESIEKRYRPIIRAFFLPEG